MQAELMAALKSGRQHGSLRNVASAAASEIAALRQTADAP
jgi:hypothetical protein